MPTQAGYTSVFGEGMREAGSLFGSAIMESMGYENKEKAVDRILKNGDWTTEEGREAMLAEVGAIDPEAHGELQKQMLEAEQTKSLTEQTRISRETAILTRVSAMHGPELIRKFQSDEGPTGQHQAIATWLRNNGIVTDEAELMNITTTAQAAIAINNKIDTGASQWVKDMNKFVGDMQTAYIKRGVYEIAGLSDTGVQTDIEAQTLTQPDLIDPPEVDDQKFYKEGDKYNANDSQFTTAWKKIGGSLELINGLTEVQGKLFTLQLEFTQKKDKKDYEDAEDAVNTWIGGAFTPGVNAYLQMQGPAYQWFKSHSPIHFKEFKKNPVAYYKKHRKEIESAADYAGGTLWRKRRDNTDLFANIPFNLDEE